MNRRVAGKSYDKATLTATSIWILLQNLAIQEGFLNLRHFKIIVFTLQVCMST